MNKVIKLEVEDYNRFLKLLPEILSEEEIEQVYSSIKRKKNEEMLGDRLERLERQVLEQSSDTNLQSELLLTKQQSEPTITKRKRRVKSEGGYMSKKIGAWSVVSKRVYNHVKQLEEVKESGLGWREFMKVYGDIWKDFKDEEKQELLDNNDKLEEYINNNDWIVLLKIKVTNINDEQQ